MGLFIFILLVFPLLRAEELSFDAERFLGTVRLMDEKIKMSWVKLRKGGYMVSGKIPERLIYEDFTCEFLTDMRVEEVRNLILEKGGIPRRVPLKVLNAYVKVNGEPYLAKPEIYYINPTAGNYREVGSEIVREVFKAMEKDPELKERFNSYVEDFQRKGLDPIEAKREALKYVVGLARVEVRRWLPEESLPKGLYLYCHRSIYETETEPGKAPKSIYEIRLYPVELRVIPEGYIRIERVEVLERDIKVVFTIAYTGKVPRSVPLDLITINPPPAKGFKFKDYRHVYAGGYLYQGSGKELNRGSYVISFSYAGEKFYTFITHQSRETTYELYIRLGYYGSRKPRKEISLWNPYKGDDSYTNTLIDMNYTHRGFLKLLRITTPVRFTFKIYSPEGYESEPFEVVIK